MNDKTNQPPQSTDWHAERFAQLKALMPDLFTDEGQLNPEQLKQLIGEHITDNERYEMRWHGKRNAKRLAFTPTTATLKFDATRSVNPQHSNNLIIEGDNLEVLKLLSTAYREQVKMIYIDPPYNTGKDFVYSDNFTEGKQAYWQNAEVVENGVRIDTNTETDGRYHSNWLNMMYSRLLIARQLLRDDGVIFISIDDNEQANLKKLCDEVFGGGHVEVMIWRKSGAGRDGKMKNTSTFRNDHEYILACFKNEKILNKTFEKPNWVNDYGNPDNDPRGSYKAGVISNKEEASNPNHKWFYSVCSPSGKTFKRQFQVSEQEFEELNKDGRIYWGKNGDAVPAIKIFTDEKRHVTTSSVIDDKNATTTIGSKEIESIFEIEGLGAEVRPKPADLIKKILQIGSDETDVVMDFFAGSGTTAQAVMELNLEDGGNRQYICVQLPELIDEKNEAFTVGQYKKISDITIARASKVIEKRTMEQPEKVAALPVPMGFKVFQLTQSNFPSVTFAPDADKDEAQNLHDLAQYMALKQAQLSLDFNPEHLITEILIKQGFNLNYQLTEVTGLENAIVRATDEHQSALVCLDSTLHDSTVAYFKTHTDERFICLERAINTTQKYNLKLSLGERFCAF